MFCRGCLVARLGCLSLLLPASANLPSARTHTHTHHAHNLGPSHPSAGAACGEAPPAHPLPHPWGALSFAFRPQTLGAVAGRRRRGHAPAHAHGSGDEAGIAAGRTLTRAAKSRRARQKGARLKQNVHAGNEAGNWGTGPDRRGAAHAGNAVLVGRLAPPAAVSELHTHTQPHAAPDDAGAAREDTTPCAFHFTCGTRRGRGRGAWRPPPPPSRGWPSWPTPRPARARARRPRRRCRRWFPSGRGPTGPR
jgi:hypothetical protein